MKIQANELMIGDWVLHDGEPYQIRQLGIYGVDRDGEDYAAVCVGKPNGVGLIVERNEIEPIHLTPEILEKNGFKRDMVYGEWQFDLDTFPFNFPFSVVQRKNNSWYLGREEIGIAHNREIIDISYVHELQHALKLCRTEKEVRL